MTAKEKNDKTKYQAVKKYKDKHTRKQKLDSCNKGKEESFGKES